MNPLPVTPKTAPQRLTPAASFQCRRKLFRRPVTVWLSLLTILLLALVFATRHWGNEHSYHQSCLDAMDSTMLLKVHWDAAPPSTRWLTGYFDRDQFFSAMEMYARHARRDGYLSDATRVRMMLASLIFERRDEAESWAEQLTAPAALGWKQRAFASPNPTSTFLRFVERNSSDKDSAYGMTAVVDPGIAARDLYNKACLTNSLFLILSGAGLICMWPLLRLLLRRDSTPATQGPRLLRTWRPERIWGAVMRAEWFFLYSGLGLLGLNGLALFIDETAPRSFTAAIARVYEALLTGLSQSVFWHVFAVILFTGPAFLMVRWLTPGFHASLRLFGIRRCPLRPMALLRMIVAGTALVWLMDLTLHYAGVYLDIFDPRDSWSRGTEMMWERILYGCLAAPFAEEFLFRGFLFTACRASWGPPLAALCSSLLFAAGHGYSPWGTLNVACFGLLMCTLYHRTGTLLVPMAIHAVTNAFLML